MKKILFLLLLITSVTYGQAIAPTRVKITNNAISTTAPFVNVQETDGFVNKINKSDLIEVIEKDSAINLPVTGLVGKIYVTLDNNRLYRWTGTIYQDLGYVDISNKVDKVTGKSLISDAEIARLSTISNFDNSGNVTALNNKVDKVTGKSLLSDAEITRLATLENYTHPANHPPSIITQDGSNRFVTDAEKSAWNAKQTALGYTAENTSNKQNSLAADVTNLKYPTVTAVNKKMYYVTPEDFGAVGDGVTNDIIAIQNAVNSGNPVRLSAKIYFISSPVQMPFRSSISGLGELSRIKTTGNYNAFEITGGDCSIFSLGILGSGSGTSNNGIHLDGLYPASSIKTNVYLNNLYINGFGNAGILFKNALNENYSPTCFASEITISGCQIGIDMQQRAEYSTFSNCVLNQNSVGLKLSGGNNSFVGGQITKNGIGVHVVAGDNNGHTNMTGTSVNHNLSNSFKIENITNGYLVDGCMIYDGDILATGSNLVKFSNCDISITNFNTNTSNIELIDNKFIVNPAFNLNLSTAGVSVVRFFNNNFVSGTIPSEATSELKGGLKVAGLVRSTDLTTIGFYQARLSDVKGSGSFGGNSFSIRNGMTSESLNFDVFNRTLSIWATPLSLANNGGAATFASSVTATDYKISALNTAPASATATGTLGEIRYDANYMYVCVATNTWKRSALTTW